MNNMRDWSVGINNVFYTCVVSLEDVPAFYYYLEMFTSWLCDKITYIDRFDLFHRYVHDPIFQLYSKHIKRTYEVQIPYFSAMKMFPKEFEGTEEYMKDDGTYEFAVNRQRAIKLSEKFDELYERIKEQWDL
jgi:hypothetical protein